MAQDNQDRLPWIVFPDRSAKLMRLTTEGKSRGLFLATRDTEEGARIAQGARDFGFSSISPTRHRIIFPDGRVPFKFRDLRAAIGGEMTAMMRDEVTSPEWTIHLAINVDPNPEGPPPIEEMRFLGQNHEGENVYQQDDGLRHARRANGDMRTENAETAGPAFLRSRSRRDLPALTAGLARRAAKGVLEDTAISDLATAISQPGPFVSNPWAPEDISARLAGQLRQQIARSSLEDLGRAVRISSHADRAIRIAQPDTDGMIGPGTAVLSLMRRSIDRADSVDASVPEIYDAILPSRRDENASVQIHDLREEDGEAAFLRAVNALARRPAEGRSLFVLSESQGTEAIDRFRSEIGCLYSLEAVAEITPNVWSGRPGTTGATIFSVGDQRPEPLDALPVAANRTFRVSSRDDIVPLDREIQRARRRIREFHAGIEAEISPDNREENIRQRPYQPLSQIGAPFTMLPRALDGATSKALSRVQRDLADAGGSDFVVANRIGRSMSDLNEVLTAEQADALAMQHVAAQRDRGFLLADDTGIGKGRSLCAMGLGHLREAHGNRLMILTESPVINAPDVYRDLKAVGAVQAGYRVGFLTSGTNFTSVEEDPETGAPYEVEHRSFKPRERRAIFEDGAWPDGVDILISTYSQFNQAPETPSSDWCRLALTENTMIVFDEAHNAANKKSNMGKNLRALRDSVPEKNVVFGTATPLRDPKGMDFYRPLLPVDSEGFNRDDTLEAMEKGGEVAQEVFTGMLSEDGTFLRRTHDLSRVQIQVNLPSDDRISYYQSVMNRFSPIVEGMIGAANEISDQMSEARRNAAERMRAQGYEEADIEASNNTLNQYSLGLGGPLANIARIVVNSIKIDQVVDLAVKTRDAGHKPLINFHSTNSALLNELSRHPDGSRKTPEEMAGVGDLTIKDQIRRLHERIYYAKIEGEKRDTREIYSTIAERHARVERLIDAMPDDLPVSPLDELIEKLEANGIRTGELSGRSLRYRNGTLERRPSTDRRATINAFNSGDLDAMIYNQAGATGGSYNASRDFADQRKRVVIEWEAPKDAIKDVQAKGRANRYNQVSDPDMHCVLSGLTAETKLLQQRNAKLRALGASIDGNRSHPLLMSEIPDLLNRVGDAATTAVLRADPDLTRRLGFSDILEEESGNEGDIATIHDEGSGQVKSGLDSIANKVLGRLMIFDARTQEDVLDRIVLEFEARIEELDSRNANPLRPREFSGEIEIRDSSIYDGREIEEGDLDTSAFQSPLYLSTGVHHFTGDPIDAERLMELVDRSQTLYGGDGFAPQANWIQTNLATLLLNQLPENVSMEDALADPSLGGPAFSARHERLTDLSWILENIQPGTMLRFPTPEDESAQTWRFVTSVVPPETRSHYTMSSAYRMDVVAAGQTYPERLTVTRLAAADSTKIFFRPGLSDGPNPDEMARFDRDIQIGRQRPVQVLGGNTLRAIGEAKKHNLGSLSLYTDSEIGVSRGIVVSSNKVDLARLPVTIPGKDLIKGVVDTFYSDTNEGGQLSEKVRMWGNMDPDKEIKSMSGSDIYMAFTETKARFDITPLRRKIHSFFAERPGLYQDLYGEDLPSKQDAPLKAGRKQGTNHKGLAVIDLREEGGRERMNRILDHLDGVSLRMDGDARPLYSRALRSVEEARRAAEYPAAETVDEDRTRTAPAEPAE